MLSHYPGNTRISGAVAHIITVLEVLPYILRPRAVLDVQAGDMSALTPRGSCDPCERRCAVPRVKAIEYKNARHGEAEGAYVLFDFWLEVKSPVRLFVQQLWRLTTRKTRRPLGTSYRLLRMSNNLYHPPDPNHRKARPYFTCCQHRYPWPLGTAEITYSP